VDINEEATIIYRYEAIYKNTALVALQKPLLQAKLGIRIDDIINVGGCHCALFGFGGIQASAGHC